MTWSWTTVRNAVWLPAFRLWLRKLISDEEVLEPPDQYMRTVGNLVMSGCRSDADGAEELDPSFCYVVACMQYRVAKSKYWIRERLIKVVR